VITNLDVILKRPGIGIPPNLIDQVIGCEALEDIQEDEILTMDKIRTKQLLIN
jgi:sialic acid synthase SpsE